MAEFTEGAGLNMQTSKSPFTSEMNNTVNSLEFINNLISSNHHVHNDHHNHHHPYDHVLAPFSGSSSSSSISSHQHHYQQQQAQLQLPTVNFTDHLHQMSFVQADHHHDSSAGAVHSLGFGGGDFTSHGSKKDKSSMPMSSQLLFASPSASEIGLGIGDSNNKTSLGGKKRKRNNKVVEKPKEVVHVRAKRGQATDSHSLAERVRREKINQRLRCLQDLVPGCYKTMGMAVMLDVIINYVRSLQNQIEFLSMKLSAASMYNELNFLEMETMQTTDQGTDAYEAWTRGW